MIENPPDLFRVAGGSDLRIPQDLIDAVDLAHRAAVMPVPLLNMPVCPAAAIVVGVVSNASELLRIQPTDPELWNSFVDEGLIVAGSDSKPSSGILANEMVEAALTNADIRRWFNLGRSVRQLEIDGDELVERVIDGMQVTAAMVTFMMASPLRGAAGSSARVIKERFQAVLARFREALRRGGRGNQASRGSSGGSGSRIPDTRRPIPNTFAGDDASEAASGPRPQAGANPNIPVEALDEAYHLRELAHLPGSRRVGLSVGEATLTFRSPQAVSGSNMLSGPSGREELGWAWRSWGGTGGPPPNGFRVYGPDGSLLHTVAYVPNPPAP